jgi:hypothetical protein
MTKRNSAGKAKSGPTPKEPQSLWNKLFGSIPREVETEPELSSGMQEVRDPLKHSALYRLKRDSLYIVAKMNEGSGIAGLDTFKRQIVFVQSQLVLAAIRDPHLPIETKAALVGFQEASLREAIEDRRGIKRRACLDVAKQAANEPRIAEVG